MVRDKANSIIWNKQKRGEGMMLRLWGKKGFKGGKNVLFRPGRKGSDFFTEGESGLQRVGETGLKENEKRPKKAAGNSRVSSPFWEKGETSRKTTPRGVEELGTGHPEKKGGG